MKNAIRRISLFLVILMLATMCFASCDIVANKDNNNDNSQNDQNGTNDNQNNGNNGNTTVIQSFELKAPKTNVTRGESITLSAVLKSDGNEEPVEDAEYIIVEGADYATITGNVLTVSNTAPNGAIINVKARDGATDSNVVTLVVQFDVTASSIVIESIGSSNIVRGTSVGLIATVEPAAAASLVQWVVTEGADYATIKGSTLIVNPEAEIGATIKVKAVAGSVESNELTFTVVPTQSDEDAAKYFISLSNSNLRLDKKGTSSPTLVADVYNFNFEKVTDVDLQFTILEGSQFLGMEQNGYKCTFTALGHGTAEVEVRVAGTNVTATATVDVIVPPDSVVLPGVFVERPNFDYSFSMVDPFTGNPETLPFAPTVKGDALACTDLNFSFLHESGATGDDVAVYENGAITFKKTGKVSLVVSSASGSLVEATTSYAFNINNGFNANSFEELSYILKNGSYDGSLPINIVVLEKPVGQTGYEYGYDLVPSFALAPQSEHKLTDIFNSYTTYEGERINALLRANDKGMWLNGNNHEIDVSQVKIFNYSEFLTYAEDYGIDNINSWTGYNLFGVVSTNQNHTYSVKVYDLALKGNAPVDYDPTIYDPTGAGGSLFVGAFESGLSIGQLAGDDTYGHYYVDADNITVSAFRNGFKLTGVVENGKVSNVYAYNCYSTGIIVRSSIITLENLKFGPCGATGIEISPDACDKAGVNDNENGKVTITGTVEASTNLNDGNTSYFQNYKVMGATVPMIITGNTMMYADNQIAHIRNDQGQFIFVSLVFNNMSTLSSNTNVVDYPAYQAGGIIDISALPTDGTVNTTHQMIRMPIYADIPGLGNQQVGVAYFYNLNYAG